MSPSRLLAGVASTAFVLWLVALTVSAWHGLDLTDESFYVSSYRWWSTNTLTFSGAQYVVGPLFDLLGQDIALLRLTRLAVLAALHVDFALRFTHWFDRTQRPLAPSTRRWVVACLAATAAAPTIWLPRTPGYNDLTLMGALFLGSAALSLAALDRGSRPPVVRMLLCGAVLVAMVLSKWSTVVVIALWVVVVVTVLVLRGATRTMFLAAALVAGGAAAGAVAVAVAMPWSEILDGLQTVNRIVAASSNSPAQLVGLYVRSTTLILGWALVVLTAVALPFVGLRGFPRLRDAYATWLAPALLLLLPFAFVGGTPVGGPDNFAAVAVAVTSWALGLVAVVLGARDRPGTWDRPSWDTLIVLGWLGALPWAFGLGTGNELFYLGFCLVAPWFAVMIALALLQDSSALSPRLAVHLGAGVLFIASQGVAGALVSPYRAPAVWDTTEAVDGLPALDGLRLTPDEVASYERLVDEVGELPPGTRLLVLDEIPGLALVLDLEPLGEAWTSRLDRERTAQGVEARCDPDDPPPVVMADREPTDTDRAALATCGVDLGDYVRVPIVLDSADLTLFRPPSDPTR